MRQIPFSVVTIGQEFKRRNFAAHDGVPGILWFVKTSESADEKNAKVVSEDYNGRELTLDPREGVFIYDL